MGGLRIVKKGGKTMPRLKQSPEQMQDLALDAAIASHAALLGLKDKKDVAERLHMLPGTYCARLQKKQRWCVLSA